MNICTALWSFVNFCCLSQSEVSTDNRKVSTFLAFQIVRCRCCYRSYLDRFLISSTSTTPKCTLHFNFDRPQTGLPCDRADRADRACYSNITADHFYSVSAKKLNWTLIKWSTAHHLNLFVINKLRFLSQNFLVRKRWVHETASSTRIHRSCKQSTEHKTQLQ